MKIPCCPVSTYMVSILIYMLELEKKSSVTVTFTLFLNAQLTFPPVKYPYCVLHCLLLSFSIPCSLDDVEEICYNVGTVYTERAVHHCLS